MNWFGNSGKKKLFFFFFYQEETSGRARLREGQPSAVIVCSQVSYMNTF